MWFCHSPKPVRVASGEVADVETHASESRNLRCLPFREESVGDATLIEDLDRARGQPAGPRAGQLLIRTPLDDGHIHAGQRKLGAKHQTGRSGTRDHHGMLGHHVPPATALMFAADGALGIRYSSDLQTRGAAR